MMYHGKYMGRGKKSAAPKETAEVLQQAAEETTEAAVSAPETKLPAAADPASAPAKAEKKKLTKGGIIFYSILGGLLGLILIAVLVLMIPLRNWLVKYEASQPEQKSVEVFAYLFANPDWKVLYGLAGEENTEFENEEAYAAYMQAKVGSQTLAFIETSAGLSGDHKYIVQLGNEKIATFTLTNNAPSSPIPLWELDTVEVFYERTVSVMVEKEPGQMVFINGKPLSDGYTIRTVYTRAEDYLPEGIHGYRIESQLITGLLVDPEVTVLDKNGIPVELTRDPESGIYSVPKKESVPMTDEERDIALAAAKADTRYSIRDLNATQLREYFDANSQVYKDIINNNAQRQYYKGYSYKVEEVTDYCRYSDTLFSAKVKLVTHVIRNDNTTKVFDLEKTYFFTKNPQGKYLVTQYSNVPTQELVEEVRLDFQVSGESIGTMMVRTGAASLTPPAVTVPEGKTFVGWALQTQDESGKVTMTVVLVPDENGVAPVTATLEPSTLIAVFEDVKEAQ